MSKDREEKHKPKDVPGEIPLEHVGNPEVMYEHQDLSPRGIIAFLVGLIVTIAIIQFVVYGLYKFFQGNQVVPEPRRASIITPSNALPQGQDPVQRFPQPTLQPDPPADLNKFVVREDQHLNSYGYIDQKQGILYIPIERAIDIVAQQGLPTRPAPVLPPRATFGSGNGSVEGGGGGVEPRH
ncbi:MAG TPA: hypothetical protein VFU76_14740 [Terriglobales bacterium]|nr:hypothetical protein [Terriglobales bacterium]